MEGGNSLLLHLDDWTGLEHFYSNTLARLEMLWSSFPSKNLTKNVYHSVFNVDCEGHPIMAYFDQFVQTKNFEDGNWLADLSESLEGEPAVLSVPYSVGRLSADK